MEPSAAYEAALDAIIGRRAEQQDAAELASVRLGRREGLLLLVADGMGGHAGGRVAAETAVAAFLEALDAEPRDPLAVRLAAGLDAANRAIGERVAASPELTGMGCTLVAAVVEGRRVTWISVGDTLLLAAHAGGLRRLNADHSMGAVLDRRAAEGEISAEEARESPQRHMLRSAVTGDRIALTDQGEAVLRPGTLLFAASDGILTLAEADLAALAAQAVSPAAFVEAALAEVGRVMPDDQDNTTIAAARLPGRPATAVPAGRRRGRPWLAALAFLVVSAAAALIALAYWPRPAPPKPPPAKPASPPAPSPPPVAAPPTPVSRLPSSDDLERFPVGPLGRPTPRPGRPTPPRPARKAPAAKAPVAKVTAPPVPPPPPQKADPTGGPARGAMDATVDQARQPPAPAETTPPPPGPDGTPNRNP